MRLRGKIPSGKTRNGNDVVLEGKFLAGKLGKATRLRGENT